MREPITTLKKRLFGTRLMTSATGLALAALLAGCAPGAVGGLTSRDVNHGLTDGSVTIVGLAAMSPAKQAAARQIYDQCAATVKQPRIPDDYSQETAAIWSGTFAGSGDVSTMGGAMYGAGLDIRANEDRAVNASNQVRQNQKTCVETHSKFKVAVVPEHTTAAPAVPLIRETHTVNFVRQNSDGSSTLTPVTVTGGAPGVVPSLQPTDTITVGPTRQIPTQQPSPFFIPGN